MSSCTRVTAEQLQCQENQNVLHAKKIATDVYATNTVINCLQRINNFRQNQNYQQQCIVIAVVVVVVALAAAATAAAAVPPR